MSTGPKPAIVPATELLEEKLTQHIIGAAIEVHRHLGPGLLESAYQECLCHELTLRRLPFRCQVDLPVVYESVALDCGYRMDLLIEDRVVVELKCVEALLAVHHAQLLTYLKLSGKRVGLMFNFHVSVMTKGIVRKVL